MFITILFYFLFPKTQTYSYNRPKCLCCPDKIDHWRHTLQCPDLEQRTCTDKFLQGTRKFLEAQNTAPALANSILQGIKCFFHQQPFPRERHTPASVEQHELGWFAFLKGLWSTKWASLQDEHLKLCQTYPISNTGKTWMKKMQVKLFYLMHQLWKEHTSSIHNPNGSTSATKSRLQNRIQQLQRDHLQANPRDTSFHLTTEDLEKATENRLTSWLHFHEELIILKIKIRH